MTGTIKMINDEMLTMVNGGDNGDAEKDCSYEHPKYQIGDCVNVYLTGLHFLCKTGKVIDKSYRAVTDKNGVLKYHCWFYKIRFSIGLFSTDWFTADDIDW